jgi:hypothetical protein
MVAAVAIRSLEQRPKPQYQLTVFPLGNRFQRVREPSARVAFIARVKQKMN